MAADGHGASEDNLVKCVVWDLDNTLWEGVLLESDEVRLRPGIAAVIATLDERGILHSIASKNEPGPALEKLREFGLHDYFLCPQIGWSAKSVSLARIRERLNLHFRNFLFIDDAPVERDEVRSEHPEVWCLDAADYAKLPSLPRLQPRFVTEDSRERRRFYQAQMQREQEEQQFQGPKKAFLESLGLRFTIAQAAEQDLRRAEELTVRTNQLNATGRVYSYGELRAFLGSPGHELIVCTLEDRYGSHGKVGLALMEITAESYHLRLFLFSCRVVSLGVGSVLLTHLLQRAHKNGRTVRADFVHTGRNRQSYVAFRLAGFVEIGAEENGTLVLEHRAKLVPPYPPYIHLTLPENTER